MTLKRHAAPRIPFSPDATLTEVEEATLQTGNTSSGADGITVKYVISVHIHHLFQACLPLGHRPKPFRTPKVTMLPKPNKRDLTSART